LYASGKYVLNLGGCRTAEVHGRPVVENEFRVFEDSFPVSDTPLQAEENPQVHCHIPLRKGTARMKKKAWKGRISETVGTRVTDPQEGNPWGKEGG